jgi:thiol-disulfide isomerase/thioredoxin
MTAAVGKFTDLRGSRDSLAGFGVRSRWVPAAAVLLPIAEGVTAILLLFSQTGRIGGAVALVLLLVFMFGIARAMARGVAPDCNCFGQISSSPAGWGTLVRNTILAIPAILIAADGVRLHIGGAVSGAGSADILGGVAVTLVLALAALVAHLGLSRRDLAAEAARLRDSLAAFPPGLPVGATAPDFTLPDLQDRDVSLTELLSAGHPVAIAFVSPSCVSCRMMFPDLARWQRVLSDRITIAVIAAGDRDQIGTFADEFGLQNVLLQKSAEVFELYRASATPSIAIVSPAGLIATRIRSSQAIVEAVIRHELDNELAPSEPAPEPNGAEALRVLEWNA